ncbi:LacI family transcriptional regulator [Massilia sp. H-1]|nr:LacI family transcriptional regulator [Massilia sp. H-1]
MATIKDVARLAGVGLGTASRVVSGKGSVSPATLEKVRQAIEELDFRPSHAARSLLSGSSQMIGVYIPVLKGTFYTPILQLIDTELRAATCTWWSRSGSAWAIPREQAIEGIEFLMERGCDGLVAMTNHLEDADIAALGPKQSRLVILNHAHASIPGQCFSADHTAGGVLAARAARSGPPQHRRHRRTAHAARQRGPDHRFMAEMARARIDTAAMWVAESDFSPEGGWNSAEELVRSGHQFSAVFCANDEMAVGALSYFHEVGMSVPRDVSVLGYDDTPEHRVFGAAPVVGARALARRHAGSSLNALLNRCYGLERAVGADFPISITERASLARHPNF